MKVHSSIPLQEKGLEQQSWVYCSIFGNFDRTSRGHVAAPTRSFVIAQRDSKILIIYWTNKFYVRIQYRNLCINLFYF